MSKTNTTNPTTSLCCKGCGRQDKQLNTFDWLADIPGNDLESEFVEVQFKNTRKGYYRNTNHLELLKGDVVAVEASPGHDIGEVTLTGRLVPLQMKKANIRSEADIKRIYRKARPVDMEKYNEAKAREHKTMIEARQIALNLNLQMKIGDVEYQGDGNKAIFYYIADERVDFRQLIKVLADAFRVRIEMKQIGARQEAGRIGGIGPCGRELCCATWMTSFVSVSTSAARIQDLSLNPQKLAGQCAKLKCCLNNEVDCYVESQKRLPSKEIELLTQDATYYFFKADILTNQITYSTDKSILANAMTISGRRAFEIINMNRKGLKPETLLAEPSKEDRSVDLVEQESLTRFDRVKKGKGKPKKQRRKGDDAPLTQGAANNTESQNSEADGQQPKGEGRQRNGEGRGQDRQGGNNRRRQRNGQQGEDGQRQPREERKPRGERPERQPREEREPRGERQPREQRDLRQPREPRGERQPREQREPRQPREPRGERQPREQREPRQPREPRGERQPREQREPRQPREQKEANVNSTPKQQPQNNQGE